MYISNLEPIDSFTLIRFSCGWCQPPQWLWTGTDAKGRLCMQSGSKLEVSVCVVNLKPQILEIDLSAMMKGRDDRTRFWS